PGTGERLVGRWRPDRVKAHDLVFSAPSSVTAVWALGSDELRAQIQQAQDAAVAEAVAYIERHFALVRRRDPSRAIGSPLMPGERRPPGPIVSETAEAILAAAFSHHTSRQ